MMPFEFHLGETDRSMDPSSVEGKFIEAQLKQVLEANTRLEAFELILLEAKNDLIQDIYFVDLETNYRKYHGQAYKIMA